MLPDELAAQDQARLSVAEAGIALQRSGAAEAIALLEPVVHTQPLDGPALLLLGEAYQIAERYEEAEFVLQRVLSIPQQQTEALIALGQLEIRRGDFAAALQHLRTALERAPQRAGLARYIESVEAAR